MHMITPKELRSLLHYDPGTGVLTWQSRPLDMFGSYRVYRSWNARFAGKPAFTATGPRGDYYIGLIHRKPYVAHRVAWAIHHGRWPETTLDHINGDTHDNRIENLRLAEHGTNMRNKRKYLSNTSGETGVYQRKDTGKWVAQAQIDGRFVYGGQHRTKVDAVSARKKLLSQSDFTPRHGQDTSDP